MAEEADQRLQGQPLFILDEETERTHGEDAQTMNIEAGKAVAEAVRTTLGPRGMDKMLVDDMGDVVMTNDGVTILEEMDIDHPAADMVVEVAETQEDETGDGTTTAVVVAGKLLDQTEELLEQGVHPQTIARGFLEAANRATDQLDGVATSIDADDDAILRSIARTAMTGKLPAGGKDQLVDFAVRGVRAVTAADGPDLEHLGIEAIAGGTVEDSRFIDGVTVSKDPVHANMPDRVDDARIALIDTALEVEETEADVEATLTDPSQIDQFVGREEEQLRDMVDRIADAGATVVFCQKGIDDMAQHYLAEAGILAIRRARSTDVEELARATGATVVSAVEDLEPDDLGAAGRVSVQTIGDEELTVVEECADPRSVTLVLRGGTEHVVEGAERAVEDALDAVAQAVSDGRVVPGGGATETALALDLHAYADSVGGREQLAVEAFADALEVVPRTIAENSGLDPIDALVDLRSHHADGDTTAGLDAEAGEPADMIDAGVIEPLPVKRQALASAQEAATALVRIDDVIAGGGDEDEEAAGGPPGGGAPGGGMPGGGMGGL